MAPEDVEWARRHQPNLFQEYGFDKDGRRPNGLPCTKNSNIVNSKGQPYNPDDPISDSETGGSSDDNFPLMAPAAKSEAPVTPRSPTVPKQDVTYEMLMQMAMPAKRTVTSTKQTYKTPGQTTAAGKAKNTRDAPNNLDRPGKKTRLGPGPMTISNDAILVDLEELNNNEIEQFKPHPRWKGPMFTEKKTVIVQKESRDDLLPRYSVQVGAMQGDPESDLRTVLATVNEDGQLFLWPTNIGMAGEQIRPKMAHVANRPSGEDNGWIATPQDLGPVRLAVWYNGQSTGDRYNQMFKDAYSNQIEGEKSHQLPWMDYDDWLKTPDLRNHMKGLEQMSNIRSIKDHHPITEAVTRIERMAMKMIDMGETVKKQVEELHGADLGANMETLDALAALEQNLWGNLTLVVENMYTERKTTRMTITEPDDTKYWTEEQLETFHATREGQNITFHTPAEGRIASVYNIKAGGNVRGILLDDQIGTADDEESQPEGADREIVLHLLTEMARRIVQAAGRNELHGNGPTGEPDLRFHSYHTTLANEPEGERQINQTGNAMDETMD